MEDYEQLDRTERLCGAVPKERSNAAAMLLGGLLTAVPWLLIAFIGGLAILGYGLAFGK